MLAVLGIGAYWYFNRRAAAAPAPAGTAQQQQWQGNDANVWGAVSKIIGMVSPSQTKTYYQQNASNSGPGGTSSASGDPYNPQGSYDSSGDTFAISPAPDIDWDSFWQQDTGDLGAYL